MAGSQDFFKELKSEVKDLGSKMNKLFDEVVRGKGEGSEYKVEADVYELDNQMIFELDLPAFDKKEVSVQIRDSQLVIKGERTRDYDGNVVISLRERSFGSFERAFTLRGDIDKENVKAKFENGVLKVSLNIDRPEDEVVDSSDVSID